MVSRIPAEVFSDVSRVIKDQFNGDVRDFSPTAGGCINEGGKLTTTSGDFFLKWNSAARYPGMFPAEAKGLALLRNAGILDVPRAVHTGVTPAHQYIVMVYIASGKRSPEYWQKLGAGLAQLHRRANAATFGLDHPNYIGSLPQYNTPRKSWIDFFITERLERQLVVMEENGYADRRLRSRFEGLYKKLPAILSESKPSLLHGDLWSGNVMVNSEGDPAIIDPAVYYGHPEVDLAMTRLFGAFDPDFYHAYQEVSRLDPGYEERFDVYNIYPLMVHVNLFGGSYIHQVKTILDRYE